MSNKLQQLGIDRWPVADRLALLEELRDSLHTGSTGGRGPTRPGEASLTRRDRTDREQSRPWRDVMTDLGGEG